MHHYTTQKTRLTTWLHLPAARPPHEGRSASDGRISFLCPVPFCQQTSTNRHDFQQDLQHRQKTLDKEDGIYAIGDWGENTGRRKRPLSTQHHSRPYAIGDWCDNTGRRKRPLSTQHHSRPYAIGVWGENTGRR
ncbi:MAG TPA: hypothetical protein VIY29_04125, partial [Ktedonobacteraceae bacterium]